VRAYLVGIGVFSATGVAFSLFQERLTRAIAAAGAREQLSRDLYAMRKLHEIGSLFLTDQSRLEPVFGRIVDAAMDISGADFGSIQLIDPRTSDLKLVAQRGFSSEWTAFWDSVAAGQGTCGTALQRGERVVIEDVESSPIFAGTPALEVQRKAGVRAVQSTPIVTRAGKPIGIFSTHHRRPRQPDPRELRLLDILARLAGDVVEVWEANRRAEEALRASELANAVAQAALGARDQVLSVVAHDLRNPLAAILMQARLLGRRQGQPERRSRRPGDTIERAATRMNRLIQDLLDVTRLEAGPLSIARDRVPGGQVVVDAVESQRRLAASAGLSFEVDVDPALPDVWADRDRLLQVLENLLGNAIKFTRRGGHITAGAASAGAAVLFWVSDSGAGIATEHLPQLFERFWQADKRRRHGAGLGLPIVKGIVEAHGGRVWVESTLGEGSTFFFTIPAAPNADAERGASPS
jgi:signal transduction histidine kinase